MENIEKEELGKMSLAPYIQKATSLIGVRRKVGGNQFRHNMATMAILIDYHYGDRTVLLKAAVIHDLLEDVPSTNPDEISNVDPDGPAVLALVKEVTRENCQTKKEYLEYILKNGSWEAKILKVADRISNLTDLHLGIFEKESIIRYIEETKTFVYPMALAVNENMALELADLVKSREKFLLGN